MTARRILFDRKARARLAAEASSIEATLEVVEGMQLDRGYLSAYFVTDAELTLADLGRAKRIIIEKDATTIIEGLGDAVQNAASVASLMSTTEAAIAEQVPAGNDRARAR